MVPSSGVGIPLKTLEQSGAPPESRLTDASEARGMVDALLRANEKRSQTDTRVKGIVDGNAPFDDKELEKAAQSWRTNANFREAEAFLATGLSAFYDLFHEVPNYSTVQTFYGTPEQRPEWSNIITEEFDKLNRDDRTLDFNIQLSQHEMVLFRMGPMIWENETDFRCRAVKQHKLLLPDGTPSCIDEWEAAVVLIDYKVHRLYEYILNPTAAERIGWRVPFVRQAIINAQPDEWRQGAQSQSWEWLQQRLRNNDVSFCTRSNVVKTAHVYWREFPKSGEREGAISHGIVLMNDAAASSGTGKPAGNDWLFRKERRYKTWRQVICPWYYDKGDGEHHGVKGMGIKFYRVLETKNRLQCHIVDAAFSRAAIGFIPTSPESAQKFSVTPAGPYHVYPFGYNFVQTSVGGVLDAPMAVNRELLSTVTSNLAQYRQNLQRTEGNPITATEVEYRASQQSVLGKTQLTRYYEQADDFWAERFRRASNPNITEANKGGYEALTFQKACRDRGVPVEALQKVTVRATRAIGQGSSFLRQASLQEILGIIPLLPESGRGNVIRDWIAAKAGQAAVQRYYPVKESSPKIEDQQWEANQENAAMRVGMLPLLTSLQNHVIHAQSHLMAASAAADSLQQGADPAGVLAFIDIAGAHCGEHLSKIGNDPTRAGVAKALADQLKQLAGIADKLRDRLKEQMQAQQEGQAAAQQAQAIQTGQDPNTQIKAAQAELDMKLKQAKTEDDIRRKQMKLDADLAAKDAKTAAGILANQQKMRAQERLNQQQAAAQAAIKAATATPSAK